VVHGLVLAPGAHEMEMTIQVLGFGEISARLRDRLV
jgi:hypothetical protein